MANNQKQFVIVINGIKESIDQVAMLNSQLDDLAKRIDSLSNKNIKVNIGGDASISTEGSVELEKQKEIAKELAQLHRDIAKGVKDENGNYTNTLKGLRAYLADLKKQLSAMELGTEQWDEFSSKVNDVNTEVKNLEKSFGVFNRQVGNYEIVAEGMDKIKVKVGDAEVEFNSFKDASKALSNELKALALGMKELEENGKQGTAEYASMAQKFNDVAKASESLEKANEYSERLKTTIQDDSGSFGELTRTFESLNSVVEMGVGVMGLFGETSEDTQKAINRTVQVMTVMKGVQDFINNDLQKGTPLVNAYNKVVLMTSKAFGAEVTAATAASTATKLFSKALIATGIGAIVVLVGTLVANFDDLKDALGINEELTKKFSSAWDKTKEVLMGVGNVILQYLVAPIKTVVKVIGDLANGDFKSALNDIANGVKEQYDVIGNYEKGAQKQASKNREARSKEEAKQRAKDLQDTIEYNEAKYGSDWKYTQEAKALYEEMFNARMGMYDKDSEDYRKSRNDLLSYQREYADKIKENEKKASDARIASAKKGADELSAIEKKIQDNKIAAMKNGYEKEMAQLKIQKQREIEEAKASGIKVNEQIQAINDKYNVLEREKKEAHYKELEKIAQEYYGSISNLSNNNNISEISHYDKIINQGKRIIDKTLPSPYQIITPLADEATSSIDKVFKQVNSNLDKNFKSIEENFADYLRTVENIIEDEGNGIATKLDNALVNDFKTLGSNLEDALGKYVSKAISDGMSKADIESDGMYKKLKQLVEHLKGASLEGLPQIKNEILEDFDELKDEIGNNNQEIQYIQSDALRAIKLLVENYGEDIVDIQRQQDEMRNNYLKQASDARIAIYQKEYEDITKISDSINGEMRTGYQSVDDLGYILQTFTTINKTAKAYDKLAKEIAKSKKANEDEIKTLEQKNAQYNQQIEIINEVFRANKEINDSSERVAYIEKLAVAFEKAGGDATIFKGSLEDLATELLSLKEKQLNVVARIVDVKSANVSLSALEQQIKNFQAKTVKTWQDWATMTAQIINASVQYIGQIWSSLAEIAYNNTIGMIQAEEDAIEDELDELEDAYSKAEEIEERHKEKVESLEDELSTARGERRTFLLNKINQEVSARERAWQEEQRIAKRQEALNKRKEELQKEADEAEKKRNRANQKIQIMQALASTALGVTQALASGPPPASIIMAALVGALGAAEVGVIASQKFANGGIIDGKSHSQGGVKVLGGTAEVEGGEYITNKRTTAKNVGLLDYINSQDKALTLSDIEDYYGGRTKTLNKIQRMKFAQGGQLQASNLDARRMNKMFIDDQRQVVVSVKDIVDVANNYKEVLVLSGEMNRNDSLI